MDTVDTSRHVLPIIDICGFWVKNLGRNKRRRLSELVGRIWKRTKTFTKTDKTSARDLQENSKNICVCERARKESKAFWNADYSLESTRKQGSYVGWSQKIAILFKDRLGKWDTERYPSFGAKDESALEMLQETGPKLCWWTRRGKLKKQAGKMGQRTDKRGIPDKREKIGEG